MRSKLAAVCLVPAVIAAACSSATVLQTNPPGAKLYLNGEYVGTSPYTMSDTKMVGSTTTVRAEYPGYEPLSAAVQRNEEFSIGACIGGVFLLVPFLWIMGYKPTHTYELRPAGAVPPAPPPGAYPAAPPPAPAPGQPPAAAPAPASAPAPAPAPAPGR